MSEKVEKVDVEEYDYTSRILGVLGNKTIFAVILKCEEVCACELQSALEAFQPTISPHLHKMYNAGLVKRKEAWKFGYYFINPLHERGVVSEY